MTGETNRGPDGARMAYGRLEVFPTTIAVVLLDETDLPREALKRLVLARYQAESGHRGGQAWESPDDLLPADDPLLAGLAAAATALIEVARGTAPGIEVARGAAPAAGGIAPESWRIETRGLVLGPGDSLPVHSHPGWDWEATFFLDTGILDTGVLDTGIPAPGGAPGAEAACGDLDFQDPRGAAPVMYAPHLTYDGPGGDTLGVSQSMTPKTGALVVYPAWLLHSVADHRGAGLRVSMTLRFAARPGLGGRRDGAS